MIGSLTFVGFLGVGIGILHFFRFKLNCPWLQVVSLLLGIQIFSLIIQLIGMTHLASRPMLICVWAILILLGGICNQLWNRSPLILKKSESFFDWILCMSILVSLLTLLLTALAPSTKIDELYYHMLLPSRIVMDRALLFYRFPIVSAILPHMIFQISLTPLHALNFPDAGNVVSWWIGLTFLWFCYSMIKSKSNLESWNWLWITAISVGLYTTVHYVTCGSHAMGDLATVAAVVLLLERRNFYKQTDCLITLAFAFSVLCLAGVTTKLAFMPLHLVILAIAGASLLKQAHSLRERKHILFALSLPWIILILPLMLWTYLKSGSPFGPVLGKVLPNSIYKPSDITTELGNMKNLDRPDFLEFIKMTFISYSPLIFTGAAGVFFVKEIKVRHRFMLATLALFQGSGILFVLPFHFRFFAGLHYAFAVLFAMHTAPAIQKWATSKTVLTFLCCFLLLPWLAGQLVLCQTIF